MVRCGSCGCENAENATYCRKCGARLFFTSPAGEQMDIRQEQAKKPIPVWFFILIAAVVMAAGITMFFLMRSGSSEKEAQEQEKRVSSGQAQMQTGNVPSLSDKTKVDENAIHRYSYVLADCGWNEAFSRAKAAGGYLARINSPEEFSYITAELESQGYHKMQFYVGGKRGYGENDYFWIDENGLPCGDPLNDDLQSWFWMGGEPSFEDMEEGIEENYINIFYYSGEARWVGNDAPENVLAHVPEFGGKVGYIIEFNE